jgi:hypothetical protein
MAVSPAQVTQAAARLNSDILAILPEIISIRNAVRSYQSGHDPYLADLGGTILSILSTGYSIVTDALTILYNTPGILKIARESGVLGVATGLAVLIKDTLELGIAIHNKKAQAGQLFAVIADGLTLTASIALFGVEIEEAPALVMLYGSVNFLGSTIGSLTGQMEAVHNVFVHCDLTTFSALGTDNYTGGGSIATVHVEGPQSV